MASIAPAAHTRRAGVTTDSWITPRWLLERLGPFDLDPCACDPQPWRTATVMVTEREDGLMRPWHGFVWCNPPYGKALGMWLNRMALHDSGIALVFARTETRAFHDHVWPFASAMVFLRGRLTFCTPAGETAPMGHNSGGPSVLIGYGAEAARRLTLCRDIGAMVELGPRPVKTEAAIEQPPAPEVPLPTLVCPTCKSAQWAEIYPSKTDRTGHTLYCRRCEEGCVSPLVVK